MKALRVVGPLLLMLVLAAPIPLAAQDPATGINFTTWQQDDPAICPHGCVYRTGQNLKEGILNNGLSPTTFGQFCNYTVDGQIYGQPLVVKNVTIGTFTGTVAYVVTQNGSVYAFDGTPAAPTGSTVPPCTPLRSEPSPQPRIRQFRPPCQAAENTFPLFSNMLRS